jgi:hypothetical protein
MDLGIVFVNPVSIKIGTIQGRLSTRRPETGKLRGVTVRN